ncbi:DUF3021 domain-containing protein [Liquorilactobacillus satsumensis]|uniref:DUF3021 domain-containing protein n=1 Tax=Liquorilactobacillus satsumensis TaxID=259059 RepID=UPI0021C399A4|nr:DUF3021 domain-containing protein [Liquorilactobacillus satsumensis]MCP9311975.1 DUF3021 domain-containing protein [Liquorilactobacillus satsumensis]MCP9359108.1 DUF3021 domain-containing protein [Liquorilactobacillus satsumensis]
MKKIIKYTLVGIPTGVFIGFMIALIFSFIYRTNNFVPSAPTFVSYFSSNTMATAVSALLWAGMGTVFSVSSLIFEKERWSVTRQTTIHFCVSYVGFTPLAILAGWFPLNAAWLGGYTLIFSGVYLIMWCVFMLAAKNAIFELNQLVAQKNNLEK